LFSRVYHAGSADTNVTVNITAGACGCMGATTEAGIVERETEASSDNHMSSR
jgi:hypothetical protein